VCNEGLSELMDLRVPQVEVAPWSVPARSESRRARPHGWLGGKFVKGPIPLNWLGRASNLGVGKAPLATALAIWYLAGLRGTNESLLLTGATVAQFGVSPSAKSRALVVLEKAGLISVKREGRKNPLVTILDVKDAADNRSSCKQDGSTLPC
jgi:DNA-binding transcriptional ArsR family regulator